MDGQARRNRFCPQHTAVHSVSAQRGGHTSHQYAEQPGCPSANVPSANVPSALVPGALVPGAPSSGNTTDIGSSVVAPTNAENVASASSDAESSAALANPRGGAEADFTLARSGPDDHKTYREVGPVDGWYTYYHPSASMKSVGLSPRESRGFVSNALPRDARDDA